MQIEIVVPTIKTESDYLQGNFGSLMKEVCEHSDILLTVVANNSRGLCEIMQEQMNKTTSDILVFIHDDVELYDIRLKQKLLKAMQYFDIVGLAGATKQTYNNEKPSLWHRSTDRENLRGFVAHYFENMNNSGPAVTCSSFGKSPSAVAVIDGLFMAFNVSKCREKQFMFDKDFKFHHYDLKTCYDANKIGLKIGVWPILVVHHGLGEFETPSWQQSDKIFKYKVLPRQ